MTTLYKKFTKVIKLTLVFMAVQVSSYAQKTDSLALMREFVQVCNSYQQLPLYLELNIQHSTNFITSEQDTATTQATFYMKPGANYIRFGEVEQLVSDSLALLVSDKLQRMILYTNAQPVLAQMKAMAGMPLRDSSIKALSKRYTAQSTSEKGVAAIVLTGRDLLYSTSLHKETIEVQYDVKTKTPAKLITIKRSLIPLELSDYNTLSSQSGMANQLLSIEGKGYYLVKEQVAIWVYKSIEHEVSMKVPFTIADRIVKNEQGEFIPVKKYETYAVTIN